MRIRGVADEAKIECEEDGFWLDVTTDEGDEIQIRLPQDVALQLETRVRETIGAWWAEGQRAARQHTAYAELDDTYEVTDPKHPAFLETADLLRDRARGK